MNPPPSTSAGVTSTTRHQRAQRLAAHQAHIAQRERTGEGFYLSCETPARAPSPVAVADNPLFDQRILFNWHNFLSGCSTWDLPQWKQWARSAANLRFNTLMIHCYGNNPIFQFEFNGQTKPVEYLSTTARGRDWSTQHIRDVRAMPGADGLFDHPVFGAQAGKVEAPRCHEAARDLMHRAFEYAASLGLGINFSWDINTLQANPQPLIRTLPDHALINLGQYAVPNPDHPDGYTFYHAQVQAILRDYPHVTDLTPWFRIGTGFGGIFGYASLESWPRQHRDTVRTALASHPSLAGNLQGPGLYLAARVTAACQRAADDLARSDVRVWTGSWRLDWIEPADALFPADVGFIPLDYDIVFDTPHFTQTIADAARNRPVVPVLWPNHDDFTYFGRCYQPPADFADKLQRMNTVGFGVIHWTTRPLDLHVVSLSRQTCQTTRNEPLNLTIRKFAHDLLGPEHAHTFATYLTDWLQTAPMVGRETSDHLFDKPIENLDTIEAHAARRTQLLQAIDPRSLDPQARPHHAYFLHFERFITDLCRMQARFDTLRGTDNPDPTDIATLDPHPIIRTFGEMIRCNGPDRGELGQLISLNTRWLPWLIDARQQAGTDPIRIAFGPTQHDRLSGLPGRFTWLFDENKQLWRILGRYEALPVTAARNDGRQWMDVTLFSEPRIHLLPSDAATRDAGLIEWTAPPPPPETPSPAVFEAGIETPWPLAIPVQSILQKHVAWPAAAVELLVPDHVSFNVLLRQPDGTIATEQTVRTDQPAIIRLDLKRPTPLQQVECHPADTPIRLSGLVIHPTPTPIGSAQ